MLISPPAPLQRLKRIGKAATGGREEAAAAAAAAAKRLEDQLQKQRQLQQQAREGGTGATPSAPMGRRGSFFMTGVPDAAPVVAASAGMSRLQSVSDLVALTGSSGADQMLGAAVAAEADDLPAKLPPPRETREDAFRRLLLLPPPVCFAVPVGGAAPQLRTRGGSATNRGPLATPHWESATQRATERPGSAPRVASARRPRSRRAVLVSVPVAQSASAGTRLAVCELPILREVGDIITPTGKVVAAAGLVADAQAPPREPAEKSAVQHSALIDGTAAAHFALPPQDSDVASAARVYVAHPSLLRPLSTTEAELSAAHGVPQAPAAAALSSLVADAQRRGAAVRAGFVRPAELAAWVLEDLIPAVNAAFPASAAPKPADLWTVASAAFAASRSTLFAHCSATVSAIQRIDQYALCAYPRLKPLILLGEKVRRRGRV